MLSDFNQGAFIFLLPPALPQRAPVAILKILSDKLIKVEHSILDYFDKANNIIISQQEAFGFHKGDHLQGPAFQIAGKMELPSFDNIYMATWRLNNYTSPPALFPIEYIKPALSKINVFYFPVQVSLPDDVHIVIHYFHGGNQSFDWTKGPQALKLIADGSELKFRPRIFNGSYMVQPGHWTVLFLGLDAFPGAPRHGTHSMAVNLGECTSPAAEVHWSGAVYAIPTS